MKTKLFSAYGLVAAMAADCSVLPASSTRKWKYSSKMQKQAVALYQRLLPEIKNEIFVSSCNIRLDEIELLSEMHVNINWAKKATGCKVRGKNGLEFASGFEIYDDSTVVIATADGTKLWIKAGTPPNVMTFELHEYCLAIMRGIKKRTDIYTSLRIPEISNSTLIRFRTLENMHVSAIDETYTVRSCIQNNRFALNIEGVKAGSGTKIVLTKSISKPFIIDGPFTAFLTHPELKEPYFVVSRL